MYLWHNKTEYFKLGGNISPSPESGTHGCYNIQEQSSNNLTAPCITKYKFLF